VQPPTPTEQLPTAPKKPPRIPTDPDVAVRKQQMLPPPGPRNHLKHITPQSHGSSLPRMPDSGVTDVDPQRRLPSSGQCPGQPPRPAPNVERGPGASVEQRTIPGKPIPKPGRRFIVMTAPVRVVQRKRSRPPSRRILKQRLKDPPIPRTLPTARPTAAALRPRPATSHLTPRTTALPDRPATSSAATRAADLLHLPAASSAVARSAYLPHRAATADIVTRAADLFHLPAASSAAARPAYLPRRTAAPGTLPPHRAGSGAA
jgi:hypothetical protein